MSTAQVIDFVSSWLRPSVEPAAEDPTNAIALHLERDGETLVLQVEGQLSVERVGALQAMFNQMWKEDASQMVVDLTACPFVDSAGLAALVKARERAHEARRRFILVGLGEQVRNLMRTTRLDNAFETRLTVKAALVN